MRAFDQIAVGFDASERGRDALLLGELLARTMDAELVAMRVDDDAGEGTEAALDEELSSALEASGVWRRARVLGGRSPAKALAHEIEGDPRLGLLALGSTHRAGFGRVVPGGTAERLLRGAACSIAVAPRGYAEASPEPLAERLRVVAVGYDASPEAAAALALAAAITQAAEATIRVISVGPPSPGVSEPMASTPAPGPTFDLQSRLHEAVAALPEELRALPIHERGSAARLLLDHAEEGVDLLVMGSRGHGTLGTALLGATSSLVIGDAPCPVVVVPRPALEQPS